MTSAVAVGSGDLLDLTVKAERSLRQLRHLCESTARSGKYVREMQAYKNAVATEQSILEKVGEMRRNLGATVQTNQVAKSITVVVVINARNSKQHRTGTNRTRGVWAETANV